MVSTYRVAVLGARGVGKSAIVRQFLYNEFSDVCVPTTARRLYLPAVVMNGHVHDLQILDFPPISAFPVNTLQVGGPGGQGAMGWWGGKVEEAGLWPALALALCQGPTTGFESSVLPVGPPAYCCPGKLLCVLAYSTNI